MWRGQGWAATFILPSFARHGDKGKKSLLGRCPSLPPALTLQNGCGWTMMLPLGSCGGGWGAGLVVSLLSTPPSMSSQVEAELPISFSRAPRESVLTTLLLGMV